MLTTIHPQPPPVLALHLNRSMHYGTYASKNNVRVHFPEVLDLTPFTTSGSLSTVPTSSISTPSPPPNLGNSMLLPDFSAPSESSAAVSEHPQPPRRSTTPTQETYAPGTQRTIYRLAAVVCHFGQHSFGHYICYRRKPRPHRGKWVPPTLVDPLRMEEEEIDEGAEGDVETDVDTPATNGKLPQKTPTPNGVGGDYFGSASYLKGTSSAPSTSTYYWEDHTEAEAGTNRGWLRISDDAVEECGIERVLAESHGAFMLYYERAEHPKLGVYLNGHARGREAKGKSGKATPRGQSMMVNGGASRSRSRSRSRNGRISAGSEEDTGADTDADQFSIGSEETLKPEMKVVDLNGSVGSLISEVGVGVMKVHKKERERERERASKAKAAEKEKELKRKESMSMSMHLPGPHTSHPPFAMKGFGPRIIRNVSAGRRKALMNGLGTLSSSSSDVGSPSPEPRAYLNGSAHHQHQYQEGEDGERIPPEMIASAPSILDACSGVNGNRNGSSAAHSHTGLGSKSTKVVHHPPPTAIGSKLKAR